MVGVNKYRLKKQESIDVRSIDNSAVRASQTARLDAMRKGRDEAKVTAALEALSRSASMMGKESTGSGKNPNNLLALGRLAHRQAHSRTQKQSNL